MGIVSESTLLAPFAGTVIAIAREPGDRVAAGTAVVILEAMKMEHEVIAETEGILRGVDVAVGETVDEGQRLAVLDPAEATPAGSGPAPDTQPRGGPGGP